MKEKLPVSVFCEVERIISVTNVVCFSLVYNDKSPFVQKTQAFEKFFVQRIELYDKVKKQSQTYPTPTTCF